MDEFEKHVQTLESVHPQISRYFQPACLYLETRGRTLTCVWTITSLIKYFSVSGMNHNVLCRTKVVFLGQLVVRVQWAVNAPLCKYTMITLFLAYCFIINLRPRTHGNVFLRFYIVSSNELVVLDSIENSKQYKNAGTRFRVYGALIYI